MSIPMTNRFGMAAALALLAVGGCKGGGSGGPASTADFCTQEAEDVCQISTTCVISMTACVTYQTAVCTAQAAAAVADGKRAFTPGNAADCLNKIKSAYGGKAAITPATLASIDLACNYVFQGTGVLLKDSCTTQFDCTGATDGSIVCDASQHLCAKKTVVPGGQQCSDVGDVCAQDFYCATNTANVSICTAAGTSAAASACSASAPCDHDSHCANDVCAALVVAGGACGGDGDCASSVPYCDPFTNPANECGPGLSFSTQSPSCLCYGLGQGCGASSGSGGTGANDGAAGNAGTGGAGGAAGGNGGTGTAGVGGGGGAAAGHGGTAGGATGGTTGTAGAGGGPTSDTPA